MHIRTKLKNDRKIAAFKRLPIKTKIDKTRQTESKMFGILEIKYFLNSNPLIPLPILFLKELITICSSGSVTNVIRSQKIVVVKTTMGYLMYSWKIPKSPKK